MDTSVAASCSVAQEETTYVSSANQPTNQPTIPPDVYLSVRLTLKHDQLDKVVDVIKDQSYIVYAHLGECKENPHFHVCLLYPVGRDMKKYNEMIRNRFKKEFQGSGNGFMSMKSRDNGVLSFIQYASHEDTPAVHSGPPWDEFIERAPKWEPRSVQTTIVSDKRPRDLDVPKQITFSNMKRAALRHRLRYNLKTMDLAEVLGHMCAHDGWDLSISIHKGGIPDSEFDWFVKMCKGENDFHQVIKRMRYTPQFLR